MSAEAIVESEGRVRMRYAVLAALGGVLVMAAAVIGLAGPHPKVSELTIELIVAHRRFPLDIISAVVNSVGLVAFALVVAFLATSTRARRQETSPLARVATLVGGVLAAIAGIAYAIVISVKVADFVKHGDQTYEQAHQITTSLGIQVLPFLGQLAALLLAMGIFFTALNAMRAGLLTRFMGYLGIFTGVLVIFPIGSPVPIVQGFWLLALGVLLADRWPNGTPPAWEAGTAIPWPPTASAAARAAAASGDGAGRAGGRQRAPRGGAPAPAPAAVAQAPRTTRAETPKRKRKKRK